MKLQKKMIEKTNYIKKSKETERKIATVTYYYYSKKRQRAKRAKKRYL